MSQDKHKAESWDDLKKWLERLKKTEPNLKEFADMILGGMKDILKARQEQGESFCLLLPRRTRSNASDSKL